GFVYGVAFAVVLKVTGFEKKLDDAVEAKVTVAADPRLVRAGELIDAGRGGDALAMLDAMASQNPSNVDVHLEILRGAKAAGDAWREARAYARLIDAYLGERAVDNAAAMYDEARALGAVARIPMPTRMRLAEHLAQTAPARAVVVLDAITKDG